MGVGFVMIIIMTDKQDLILILVCDFYVNEDELVVYMD